MTVYRTVYGNHNNQNLKWCAHSSQDHKLPLKMIKFVPCFYLCFRRWMDIKFFTLACLIVTFYFIYSVFQSVWLVFAKYVGLLCLSVRLSHNFWPQFQSNRSEFFCVCS